jgi:hypothetical protein
MSSTANQHGLLVDACLTQADGHAERVAALYMIEPRADRPQVITLGADKAYDAEDFINELRAMKATPHVAQNTSGRSISRIHPCRHSPDIHRFKPEFLTVWRFWEA